MTAAPLTPRLQPLDKRVLAVVAEHSERADAVAALLFGEPHWECERCGHADWDRGWGGSPRGFLKQRRRHYCGKCWNGESWYSAALQHPLLIASEDDTCEVREILRGLERVGLASCRGGWWRAT